MHLFTMVMHEVPALAEVMISASLRIFRCCDIAASKVPTLFTGPSTQ